MVKTLVGTYQLLLPGHTARLDGLRCWTSESEFFVAEYQPVLVLRQITRQEFLDRKAIEKPYKLHWDPFLYYYEVTTD